MKVTEWDQRLKKYGPDDLPVLADALLPFGRASVEYRLPLLHAKAGADPRLAEVLTGWVEQRPAGFQGQPTDGFWKAVLKVLAAIGDGAQRARLEAVLQQVEAKIGCHADTVLRAGLPAVIAQLGPAPALAAAPGSIDVPALFAAVYADPDADAPRAVLADALLAAGDPRGELISLQLAEATRARTKRCRELIAAHGKAWTGGLANAVRKEGLAFTRGFVQSVHLGPTPAPLDLAACPELATVETMHVAQGLELPAQLWPQLKSLKALTGHVGVALWADARLPRLETLEVHGGCDAQRLVACSGLPRLQRLWVESMLHGPERLPLWAAPIGNTLTHVHLASVFGTVGEWRAWMQSAPPQVGELSAGIVPAAMRLSMNRYKGGWRAVVLVNTHGDAFEGGQDSVDATVDSAGAMLAASGFEACAMVEVVLRPNTRGSGWPATSLPPSDAAIARLKALLPRAQISG